MNLFCLSTSKQKNLLRKCYILLLLKRLILNSLIMLAFITTLNGLSPSILIFVTISIAVSHLFYTVKVCWRVKGSSRGLERSLSKHFHTRSHIIFVVKKLLSKFSALGLLKDTPYNYYFLKTTHSEHVKSVVFSFWFRSHI